MNCILVGNSTIIQHISLYQNNIILKLSQLQNRPFLINCDFCVHILKMNRLLSVSLDSLPLILQAVPGGNENQSSIKGR